MNLFSNSAARVFVVKAKHSFLRNASVRCFASVGDKLPAVELHHGFPPKKHNLAEYAKNKSILLVGLPGAFTPTWSTKQIPNYLENQDALRKAGIDGVIVYCVNDAGEFSFWDLW